MVASLLGGATLLFSCKSKRASEDQNLETLITQQSDTLTLVYSKNGKTDYRFATPIMERYELARDPYMEFRYGVEIITFDSLGMEESSLVADYAIFYEKRELWEGRGNVVASGNGRTLFTQQLFWDQKTDKIYSNVDSKVEEEDGSVFVGEGFESDSKFNQWTFRESEGRMWVDTSVNEQNGSDQADDKATEKPKTKAASGQSPMTELKGSGSQFDRSESRPRVIKRSAVLKDEIPGSDAERSVDNM